MDEQWVMVLLYLVALSGTVQQCLCFSSDQLQKQDNVTDQIGSSVILPVSGNVYPKGYLFVVLLLIIMCVCVCDKRTWVYMMNYYGFLQDFQLTFLKCSWVNLKLY